MDTAPERTEARKPTRQVAAIGGALVAVVAILWLLLGMPGIGLEDGGYACGDYSATVEGGELVAISNAGTEAAAVTGWDGARRAGDHRFTVTVQHADGSTGTIDCLAN